ncbi:hypothetical protein [Sphingomonas xinjiangensis]|uniref:Uncharacterized protein n=1 Tax=Sphingomonas xinjiangensis TaxID=643568 RepID=A0A840YNH3_9SPHN|nr:hypothetical protein [Sphingomonas xinjiangensis]MBB5711490.1 hypothetical protein [Sphingomonas xinjiangensis]
MTKTTTLPARPKAGKLPGVSPNVLLLREELRSGMDEVAALALGGRTVAVCAGRDALWVIVRRGGRGGIALRAAHAPGGCGEVRTRRAEGDETLRLEFDTVIGRQTIAIRLHEDALPVLRVTTWLRPCAPLLVPFLPRDLYPLDANDDPAGAVGQVEAAQRGMNAGVSYFRMTDPAFGSTLYFQNFTTLNPYFEATGTKPDGAVGGEWPEIGYLPPTAPQKGKPPLDPLPEGADMAVLDSYLAFHDEADADEAVMAHRYLMLLGAIYRRLELPPTQFRDWVGRAERSLHDLDQAPQATIRHYGFRYIHPYTATEYPDSMVQMSVLASIRDYEAWKKEDVPLLGELKAGLRKFYDSKLKTMRRYLPNVGPDKDKDAVDSWYLYHPLMNLGRLAIDGDKRARKLFIDSVDFGIEAAHHFDYRWPIQYNVTDFSIITAARDDAGLGQTDVGGIYAYVMLQAFELTDDKRFLDEARAAIDAARGMRFELNYQANLTAWGASACMRLWRITNDEAYLDQSYVYLASFFHNASIWESEIDHAKHYRNFLGVTALHDAPYMAMYECFDSFAAFERYLKDSGPDLEPAVRLLLGEYCRYALDRAWFYYPDALPEDAVASENVRNSYVDRNLSFPVEDLYVDGQQAGQVGQEIYGAGAAFVFASRTFHPVRDAPFAMFCDHFLLASDRPGERALNFQLGGAEGCTARLCLIRSGKAKLPEFTVTTMAGDRVRGHAVEDRIEFHVPANGRVSIAW